jgi:DNA end-binding protein Ku
MRLMGRPPGVAKGQMPRSTWNGTIAFGLVAVPVKVHSATEDKSVHFHQVHAADGARIKQKRLCSKEGEEVPYEEIAKGYQTREGEYVLLAPEEIAAAAGERSRLIELEEFVCGDEIDPVYYDRAYYLGAGADGADAYRLLHDALERSGRVGIGRWVFHNREYLVAVRPQRRVSGARSDVLALTTMRFAEELVEAEKLLDAAVTVIEELSNEWDPSKYEDRTANACVRWSHASARATPSSRPSAHRNPRPCRT